MQSKKNIFLFLSLFLLISCGKDISKNNPLEVPSVVLNDVLNCANKDSLIVKFGSENIILDTQIIYQMDTLDASILYPNSKNQVYIFYQGEQIQDVRISGEYSQWITSSGLYLGQSLKDVQEINQMHFTISGFGWNYGGTVISWEGGVLGGNNLSHLVKFKNQEDLNGVSEENFMEVKGDLEFDIRHETIQNLDPKLVEIALYHPKVPGKEEGKELGMKLEHRQMERK